MSQRPTHKLNIHRSALLAVFAVFLSGTAAADVVSAAPGGFLVEQEVEIAAPRARVWQAAIDEVGQWWNDAHTVSGDAARLSIDARPLGCFCETLSASDGVTHLMVTSVSRGVMLRMTGGLGPLGLMGVNGNMTWEFFDAADGASTRVRFTYAVGGYSPDGLDTFAEPVDGVIAAALDGLKLHVQGASGDDEDSD